MAKERGAKLAFEWKKKKKTISLSLSPKNNLSFFFSFLSLSHLFFSLSLLPILLNIRRRAIQQQPQTGHIGLVVLLDNQEMQPPRGGLGALPGRGLLGGRGPGGHRAVAPPLAHARVEDEAAALRVGREGGDLVAGGPGGEGKGAPRVDGDACFFLMFFFVKTEVACEFL